MMLERMTTHTCSMVDLRSFVSCCVLLVACAKTTAPQGEGLGTAGDSTLQDGGCAHSSVMGGEPRQLEAEPCPGLYAGIGACSNVALDLRGRPFEEGTTTRAVASIEDVRCLLRALRDRTRGQLWFTTEYAPGMPPTAETATTYGYKVLADLSVIFSVERATGRWLRARGRTLPRSLPSSSKHAYSSTSDNSSTIV
jgi:hypothetical protein